MVHSDNTPRASTDHIRCPPPQTHLNRRCEIELRLSLIPVIVIKCSNSFTPKLQSSEKFQYSCTVIVQLTVIRCYGITLSLCIIFTWPRLLFSSHLATSVTVSSVTLNAVLPSCALRNAALHSGHIYIHKVLKIAVNAVFRGQKFFFFFLNS